MTKYTLDRDAAKKYLLPGRVLKGLSATPIVLFYLAYIIWSEPRPSDWYADKTTTILALIVVFIIRMLIEVPGYYLTVKK